MPVVKEPEGKEWPLAPEGLHNAVCVDAWPIWTEEKSAQYGGGLRDMTRLVWQLEDSDENGVPYEVSKRYTASLHEKSNLRKDLEMWRGKRFTDQEARGFELDVLIGVSCQLQLLHNVSRNNGKTYANITGIMPLGKGAAKVVPTPGYVRKKDRPANPGQASPASSQSHEEDDDSMGVPF